jgi:hypothetical protein
LLSNFGEILRFLDQEDVEPRLTRNRERRVSGTPSWDPDDTDRTIIRPAARQVSASAGAAAQKLTIIDSPLLTAATPLLQLLDWWLNDQAVRIDTPGRWMCQDLDTSADRADWYALLDVLTKTGRKPPLDGMIVAVGTDVAGTAQARLIRQRVDSLQRHFGLKVPIYIFFTKVDLVAGFTAFFDGLDHEAKSQVWGRTFPLGLDPGQTVQRFSDEFRALIVRLEAVMFRRLQAERRLEKHIASGTRSLCSWLAAIADAGTSGGGGATVDSVDRDGRFVDVRTRD